MNLLLRILSVFLNVVNTIAKPIFWFKSLKSPKTVSTISDALLKISATDLAEKIRKRELSSETICSAYIKRIKEVNPILNAVAEERFESALQDARRVDQYLQTSQESEEEIEKTKPLLGVPLTVKESCSVAGLSHVVGTLSRTEVKSKEDGAAVSRLRSGGAIPLLVSNTPELCLSWECNNFITGKTNNPYDSNRTSGGSSGGEGALLGAGASLIGIGSDVAGSIRLPAMFNCVFGHKPTSRTIPIKGHFPYCNSEKYWDYFAIGPMTRYAKDLKLMTKVMCEEGVVNSLRLEEKVDLGNLRIFFMKKEPYSFGLSSVQKEISSVVVQCVNHLKKRCHCQVEEFKFNDLKNSCEIAGSSLYGHLEDIPNLVQTDNKYLFLEILKSIVGLSKYTFNLLLFYFMQWLYTKVVVNDGYFIKNENLKELFTNKLGDNGVFLYPTYTTSSFFHNCSMLNIYGVSYLMIFNTLGLPSTHVPCGFDDKGLPIGIQVVGGPYQDRLCFAVAEELEKRFGGWIPPN